MHLERLDLTNFKCFAQQSLRFSKLTVLLGANSSGKSSLLHGVLAAIQTDQFPLALSANGALVDLGDFQTISHRRKSDQDVGVTLTLGGRKEGTITLSGTFRHSGKSGMPELLRAELANPCLSMNVTRDERYRVAWTYNTQADKFNSAFRESADLRRFFQAIAKLISQAKGRQKRSLRQKPEAEGSTPVDLLAAPPPSGQFAFSTPRDFPKQWAQPKYLRLSPHVQALSNAISELRQSFNYVGSFRLEPQRSYYQVTKGDLKVLRDGQNYIEQLAEWEDQKAWQLRLLINALSSLRLLSRVHASRLRSGIFEVKVRSSAIGVPVSLPDVGFGISQLLPILVADLQLPKGGTLAVSQPEIHLHPSVQADLAEHFVRNCHSRGIRYIIETHSEYFLNRLRLLIAKGKLLTEDVSVLYLTNDGTKSTGYDIHFLPNGRIEGAPDDFFKTYMIDVMNIAMTATEK